MYVYAALPSAILVAYMAWSIWKFLGMLKAEAEASQDIHES